ncbi:MAG: insulinase family protein [Dehalococcoidia bacterium]|nr:insulinase family protein [Dehalococcoidia bacterium]
MASDTTSNPGGDILPFPALQRTLDNGLRVIVVNTGFPNLVSVQIPVRTGSRNEVEEGKSGFAHFFEHMMFRGTEQYPPDRYHEVITRMGARQNAYTTDDYTNYHASMACRRYWRPSWRMEADLFHAPSVLRGRFPDGVAGDPGRRRQERFGPALTKLLEVQREYA